MQLTAVQKSKSGIGVFVISLVISAALVFFLVLPKYREYTDSKTAAANNQNTLNDTQKQDMLVSKLFDKVKNSADDLKRADLAVPPKSDVPELYAYVESLAKTANLTLTTIQTTDESEAPDLAGASAAGSSNPKTGAVSLSPTNLTATGGASLPGASGQLLGGLGGASKSSPLVASGNLGVIDINLTVTGTYSNFTAFLSKLQNSLRLIDVQSVSVASAEGKTDLSFIAALKTYYQK
ncbi:MAG: hypothetical protein NVSMB66_3970 [Candidatus Doudnabacteria bacterium]